MGTMIGGTIISQSSEEKKIKNFLYVNQIQKCRKKIEKKKNEVSKLAQHKECQQF